MYRPNSTSASQIFFTDACNHYETVANSVNIVSELFPFIGASEQEQAAHLADEARRQEAIAALQKAHHAEQLGLETLEKIANELQPE